MRDDKLFLTKCYKFFFAESHDDDKIVKFHWDKASGPLNSKNLDDIITDQALLIIKNLVAGKYTFR